MKPEEMEQEEEMQQQPAQETPQANTEEEVSEESSEEGSSSKEPKPKSELEQKIQDLINEAKGMIYGDGYESMIQLFKQNGKKGFSDAIGIVVPGVLAELEKRFGEQDVKILLMVGIGIIAMLSSDLSQGGIVPDLDGEDVRLAMGMVIAKWLEKNPDRQGSMEKATASLQQEMQKNPQPKGQPNQLQQQPANAGVMGAV